MIVSHSHRFIFCHLHKTGGESVTEALAPHLGWNDVVLGVTPTGIAADREFARRFNLSKHSTAKTIKGVVGDQIWEDYLTFTVVRHPVDRMESLYNWLRLTKQHADRSRIRHGKPPWPRRRTQEPWNWAGMEALLSTRDFSGFIRHPAFRLAPGVRAQTDSLGEDGRLLVQRILRFETLAQDFTELTAELGIPATLGWRNRSSGARSTLATAADRELLNDLFARDLEAFGYEGHPPSDS